VILLGEAIPLAVLDYSWVAFERPVVCRLCTFAKEEAGRLIWLMTRKPPLYITPFSWRLNWIP